MAKLAPGPGAVKQGQQPPTALKWGPAPVDYQQTMPNLGVNATYIFTPSLIQNECA